MTYDFNAKNYNVNELFVLLDIDEYNRNIETLENKSNMMLTEATNENNNDLITFINDAKDILIEHINEDVSPIEERENNISMTAIKDELNPNFQNIITKFINVDSQYKETINTNNSSTTNFSFEFTETVSKAISFKLYSIEIPYSWYTFDKAYGTTSMAINDERFDISSGNYSPIELVNELNSVFIDLSATLVTKCGKIILENKSDSK